MYTQGLARAHEGACDSKSCACERDEQRQGLLRVRRTEGRTHRGREKILARPRFNLIVPPIGEIEEGEMRGGGRKEGGGRRGGRGDPENDLCSLPLVPD